VQTDIKKVLAYSTVSQLGYMFIGVGVGAYFAGVLHLVTHAFFKACLFLGAGSVMHGMGDDTDIRNMGGLWKKMPATAKTFLIATIAATGVLPLSGFFSKDAILAGALFSHNPAVPWVGKAAYALGTITAAGTAFYMTRLFVLTFVGKPRTHKAEHAHESASAMTGPLWVLAILAVVALLLGLPEIHALGPFAEAFKKFTDPVFAQAYGIIGYHPHEIHGIADLWPFAVAWGIAILFTLVAWAMYAGGLRELPGRLATSFRGTYQFAYDKFRVDEFYEVMVINPVKRVAYFLWRVGDALVIEGIVNGTAKLFAGLGKTFRFVQNGDVQRYAALMAFAAAVILWTVLGSRGP
jgi:NADH-quinone oxidoreductase subunit L